MVGARHFEGLRGVDLGLPLADLAGRPAEEQIRKFVGRVQLAGLMHSEDTLGQIHRFLRVYRAGVRAYRAYRPRPYGGPITLIRASTQTSGAPADLGWSAFTSSPVDHREVPGNHVTMFAESNVRALAGVLRDCLRERSEQPVP
jgi:thioesterase domain-containing protein